MLTVFPFAKAFRPFFKKLSKSLPKLEPNERPPNAFFKMPICFFRDSQFDKLANRLFWHRKMIFPP